MPITEYKTIHELAKDEFTEKKSLFIGSVMPVSTVEEANSFVALKKSEYKDANHNVWAYLLKDGQKRYSDDGEPQGTAGVPCLDVLEKSGITDICVVATRYFGGILLGGGGLCRAYSHTVSIAIAAARIKLVQTACFVSISCDYAFYGKLSYMLPDFEAVTKKCLFEEDVKLSLIIKESLYGGFEKELISLSNGRVLPQIIKKEFFGF